MTRRLFFGYLLALLCVLATLAASRQLLVALHTDSDAARTQHTAALKGLVELRGAAHELMDGARTLERGAASVEAMTVARTRLVGAFDRWNAARRESSLGGTDELVLGSFQRVSLALDLVGRSATGAVRADPRSSDESLRSALTELLAATDVAASVQVELLDRERQTLTEQNQVVLRGLGAVFLILIIAGAVAAFVATRQLQTAAEALALGIRRLRSGNYSEGDRLRLGGELGQIATDLEELRTALQLAEQRRAALLEALGQKAGQLQALQQIGREIAASLDLESVLSHVAEKAAGVLKTDGAAIALCEEASDEIVMRGVWGAQTADILAARCALGRSLVGAVVHYGRALRVRDFRHEPRITRDWDDLALREGIQSAVAVPLKLRESTIGTLLAWSRTTRTFSLQDAEVLGELGGQVTIAIQNARLYQEAQARLQESEAACEQAIVFARELRQALRQEREVVAQLKAIDELKSDFVSMVSHELRNPIATVHGYATILLRHSGSLQPAQQIRFLDVISRETSRLSSMVEDVLTVSRLDAGRLSYAFRPIDLTAIVAQTVDEVRGLDAAHEFQIDLPSELCIVNADGGRLKQAMINLLNNAIKYSPHGERIRVWLRTDRSARECVVGVADDGPGVPLAEADRLFQKFSRLRTTAETPGTGLGLYITKGIVEAHNGRVWVESVPGEGATFLFAIPLESSERAVAIGEPVA